LVTKVKAGSNKTETYPKKPSGDKNGPGKPSESKSELVPFIDKISITLNPHPVVAKAIKAAVKKAIGDQTVFEANKHYSKEQDHAKRYYKISRHIACQNSSQRVFFQCEPNGESKAFCRFEFNPEKLGSKALGELHKILKPIFPDGFNYVIQCGRVSKIDIAIDLPNLHMDAFLVLPELATSSIHYRRNGRLETLYIGKPRGTHLTIYDKHKEQLAKKHKPSDCAMVRVEKTLVGPSPEMLKDIADLPNPFAKLRLTYPMSKLTVPPAGTKINYWTMFGDCVRRRGLDPALALLPYDRRIKYRKHFTANTLPIWEPAAIWANWGTMLNKLGLIDQSALP